MHLQWPKTHMLYSLYVFGESPRLLRILYYPNVYFLPKFTMVLISPESLCFFFFGSLIFAYHTKPLIYRCLKSLKRRSSIVLLTHIATSTIEVLRYYGRLAISSREKDLQTDIIDVILAIIQTTTSFQLTRDRVFLGYRPMLKPVYYSQAILRLFFSAFAHAYSQPWLYKASIVINMSFVYPRLITYMARRLFDKRMVSDGNIHTFSVLVSALLAMHDTGVPLGPQILLIFSAWFVWLEKWMA